MKKTPIIIVLLITMFGCNKDNPKSKSNCNVSEPTQELPWLKKIIEEQKSNKYNKMTIHKCDYKQQSGFLIDFCVGCADALSVLYNCEGKVICDFGGLDGRNTCPDFASNSIMGELIFIDTIVDAKPDLMPVR